VEPKVSQSLIMAMIKMESGGNPGAVRYEPAYERKYILNNRVWIDRQGHRRRRLKPVRRSYPPKIAKTLMPDRVDVKIHVSWMHGPT
jgi:hypothetical protein